MSGSDNDLLKIEWQGTIVSIQPRTTVWRYRIDNRTHGHIGYNIFLDGDADGVRKHFAVAISEKQQQTVGFRIGDEVKGTAWTKKHPQWEFADYYRAGGLKRVKPNDEPTDENNAPPWLGTPPDMGTYEWRGCRVLSKACWNCRPISKIGAIGKTEGGTNYHAESDNQNRTHHFRKRPERNRLHGGKDNDIM